MSGEDTASWGVIGIISTVPFLVAGVVAMAAVLRRARRAASAVSEREQLFRGLIDNSLDVITLLDANGAVQMHSPSLRTVLGWDPDALLRSRHPLLIHPTDLRSLRVLFAAVVGSCGQSVPVSFRHRHANGEWRRMEGHMRSFATRPGSPLLVVAHYRDTTDQHDAEEHIRNLRETLEIRVSERTAELSSKNDQLIQEIIDRTRAEAEARRLSAAIEQSASPVLLLGRDRTVEYANRRFLSFAGYTRELVVGKGLFSWNVKPLEAEAERAIWTQVDAGQEWSGEALLWRANGSTYWAWLTLSSLHETDGSLSGYLASAQDITARKAAEEEKARLSYAVEQAAEAIVITNARGSIQYVNPAFEQTTGWPRSEVIGRNPRLLKSGVHDDAFYRAMWDSLNEGRVWSGRLVNRRKDGSLFHEDATISPVRDAEGKVVMFVAVKRDVTELLQMEEQLRQAQKLESIGQLAAGIAHEINTPIQFIGDNVRFLDDGFAGLRRIAESIGRLLAECPACSHGAGALEQIRAAAEEADLPYLLEEIPKALAQSQDGVERVSVIVRAMKEFSHPGSLDLAPADLNHAISNTITVSRNEWKYEAEMETDFDPSLPPVPLLLGDFNQVVLNLVVNAAHAIADRRRRTANDALGRIRIATRLCGDQVEVRVADDGCGISDANKQRIFTPFFTTKEVGRGTGQGLAFSRTVIVRKLNGTLSFESQEGAGSTFIIRLPLEQPARSEQRP